jgi:hypothetical protein
MLISDDGYATVPPEVLDDAGNIFFGVKGYISDLPQLRKTSLNVMYEIRNGSSPSGDNAPTPDEFTQMLQEMGNIKQEVANEIAEMNAALEEMKKQLDEKLQDDSDGEAGGENGVGIVDITISEAGGYTLTITDDYSNGQCELYINGVKQENTVGTWTDVDTVGLKAMDENWHLFCDDYTSVLQAYPDDGIVTAVLMKDETVFIDK